VAGVLADRFDRRRLLVGANLVEGALTVVMAGAAATGHLHVLQIVLFLRASVSALREPAANAVLRRVVHERELLAASSLLSTSWSVMFATR
jgi:MFS family permease